MECGTFLWSLAHLALRLHGVYLPFVHRVLVGIWGQQITDVGRMYLLIWNGKFIGSNLPVIALDGEVAALIEQWQSVGDGS